MLEIPRLENLDFVEHNVKAWRPDTGSARPISFSPGTSETWQPDPEARSRLDVKDSNQDCQSIRDRIVLASVGLFISLSALIRPLKN